RRRLFQVHDDAALAARVVLEAAAHATMPRHAGIARRIAFRRFDLDHIGAVVRQDAGAPRAHLHGGEIEHPDAVERTAGHRTFFTNRPPSMMAGMLRPSPSSTEMSRNGSPSTTSRSACAPGISSPSLPCWRMISALTSVAERMISGALIASRRSMNSLQ